MIFNLNKKQATWIAIIVAVGLVLSGLILLGGGSQDEHGENDGHGHASVKKDEKRAAGKSEVTSDATQTQEKEVDNVKLNAEQIKTSGIKIEVADTAFIRTSMTLPGEIRFNEDRTAHIVPRVSGVVLQVTADLGQQVRKGQVLAVMASTAVSEQRSELSAAQKRLKLAQLTYAREKMLWQEKVSAEQDFLQAQQALQESEIAARNAAQKLIAIGADAGSGRELNRYEIRAPFDGMVVEKHISLGESLKEDTPIFTLSDLGTVWAEIAVPASNLPHIRVGESVVVKADAFASSASGKVAYVGSLLGAQTRTATARVTLTNPQGIWRPGLFVTIDIMTGENQVPVAVSKNAIHKLENRDVVFVRTPDGFRAQAVQLGRSDGKRIEVLQGMQLGQEYAAEGSFVVRSELGKASVEHTH
ncbi:efflux RND transporter periplasmic adaptor subunit [uncultured Oxalicibacterium sp.]|uniref:efflux RND transporter periplasmic adaptor subunit n=1 Tax=uncultured Oxalicibacterium sp. TaxID=1168540 RepID=UPI0025FE3385|nr:efflux RND transporter periplasmic adaptor subunit [uncultured Oxalicibacterium sp.]